MRTIAALLACISLSTLAATPTTDFSDLWFNPAEEGWGVTLSQQNDILFITMFVYGPDNKPKWYVGPATRYLGNVNGKLSFSGPLYEATGPYFGTPVFDENQVAATQVGDIAFAAAEIATGTLSYRVGEVLTTKTVQRQTWAYENLTGVYVGASLGAYQDCGASRDGYFESPATVTVVHTGNNISFKEEGTGYTCNYAGTYIQRGRYGEVTGAGTCTGGVAQSFIATEVQGSVQGLSLRYGVQFGAQCRAFGRMGGVRKGTQGL